MICEVIVDIAHSEVDKVFEYVSDGPVAPGTRVAVPFGASVATGFVIREKERSDYPAEKLKRILRVEDAKPAINKECLALAKGIAARYRVPMALALRLFLPAEMRTGKVAETYRTYARFLGEVPTKNAPQQAACLAYLREHGEADAAELRKQFGAAVNALVKKGGVALEKRRVLRDPYKEVAGENVPRTLTPAQMRAVETVERTDKSVVLLHGVTGSGKTEVYLTLIARALERGQTAIFLVPEISLTPQMLSQLRARFGSLAAIMHSGLSAGERFDEWQRLREGSARIAIGARSAVFVPVENVGVIVLDEEHDGSYSSESAPRYNTFDIALQRAKYNGCKLVLGSATPSVETYKRALDGEFELVRMPDRINARPLPDVNIVDMRREVKRGNASPFRRRCAIGFPPALQRGSRRSCFSTAAAIRRPCYAATAGMSPSASTATSRSPITAKRTASNATIAAQNIKCSPPAPSAAVTISTTRGRVRSASCAICSSSTPRRASCAWTTIRRAGKRGISAS